MSVVLNQALRRVWAACAAAGKPVGVHAADGATARRYREAGCGPGAPSPLDGRRRPA